MTDTNEFILKYEDYQKSQKKKLKYDKKLNLICRMAGNIYDEKESGLYDSVNAALSIFDEVKKRLQEE